MAQAVHFKAVVEKVDRHDANVASFRLKSEKRLPRFVPGQFIHLSLDEYDGTGFWPESRVFSVANAVADRRTVDLTIGRQGKYTSRILDEVSAGDAVWAKGPYGQFTVHGRHGWGRAVLIAGGTGITPFCAFMDAALVRGALPLDQVILYYGARTVDLLIFRGLAERCAGKLVGFRVNCFAEQGASGGGSEIRAGALDLTRIMAETGDRQDTAYYLSGPRAMTGSFQQRLVDEFGVRRERVLIDAWE
jgi:ferredoxin-NADP reductase